MERTNLHSFSVRQRKMVKFEKKQVFEKKIYFLCVSCLVDMQICLIDRILLLFRKYGKIAKRCLGIERGNNYIFYLRFWHSDDSHI